MQGDPPQWALDITRVKLEEIELWLEGAARSKWKPPLMIATADEIVYAERGFFSKFSRRVPRSSVVSTDYHGGFIWDFIRLHVSGGDSSDLWMNINRKRRQDANAFMDMLKADQEKMAAASE